MINIKSFKNKKNEFDKKITILKEFSEQADEFYISLQDLKNLEKKKSKVTNKMLDFVTKFYNKDCIYYPLIKKIQKTFKQEIEKTNEKVNFINSIREFNKRLKIELKPILKQKNGVYKLFKQEFHYLNKLNDLKKYKKKLTKNKKETKSIQKKIETNDKKLEKATFDSNKGFSKFNKQFTISVNNRFSLINPYLKIFLEKQGTFFGSMNNNYGDLLLDYEILNQRDKIENYRFPILQNRIDNMSVHTDESNRISGLSRFKSGSFDDDKDFSGSKMSSFYGKRRNEEENWEDSNFLGNRDRDTGFFDFEKRGVNDPEGFNQVRESGEEDYQGINRDYDKGIWDFDSHQKFDNKQEIHNFNNEHDTNYNNNEHEINYNNQKIHNYNNTQRIDSIDRDNEIYSQGNKNINYYNDKNHNVNDQDFLNNKSKNFHNNNYNSLNYNEKALINSKKNKIDKNFEKHDYKNNEINRKENFIIHNSNQNSERSNSNNNNFNNNEFNTNFMNNEYNQNSYKNDYNQNIQRNFSLKNSYKQQDNFFENNSQNSKNENFNSGRSQEENKLEFLKFINEGKNNIYPKNNLNNLNIANNLHNHHKTNYINNSHNNNFIKNSRISNINEKNIINTNFNREGNNISDDKFFPENEKKYNNHNMNLKNGYFNNGNSSYGSEYQNRIDNDDDKLRIYQVFENKFLEERLKKTNELEVFSELFGNNK